MATTMERPGPDPVHPRPKRRAPWPVEFYRSAVGKKWVMALTGIMIMGFVFFHAFGNLKVYLGAEDFNHYGEFLREMLVPLLPRTWFLWIMRPGPAAGLRAPHPLAPTASRDEPAGQRPRLRAVPRLAGRQLRQQVDAVHGRGHRCFRDLPPRRPHVGHGNPDFVRGDVYRNFVASFSRTPIALVYIVANLALCLHLFHGAWSMFQSLGLNNPKWNKWRRASPSASPPPSA